MPEPTSSPTPDRDSTLLAALRSAKERHAIALLDVQIEKIATGWPPDHVALLEARNALLRCLVDLSRELDVDPVPKRIADSLDRIADALYSTSVGGNVADAVRAAAGFQT